jgi:chromosomal replication initiation ATPase DnaA
MYEARNRMNKTVSTIATLIQPGKPLMIIGPYGCGKDHATYAAIKSLGLKPGTIYLSLLGADIISREEVKSFTKSMYGNTVLMFSDIQCLYKSYTPYELSNEMEDLICHQMSNPERRVVLTGVNCYSQKILAKVSQRIQMVPVSLEEFD